MIRVLAFSLAGLLALYVAVAVFGLVVMPSYLAAWLVCLSVPVGALPLVMGLELAGQGRTAPTGVLRGMLLLMPVAALAGLPILFFLPGLYPWVAHPPQGFAALWFSQTGFVLRSLAYLGLWSVLALALLRPPATSRIGLCGVGLALHAVIGTLAATDWIVSLSPGLNVAGFGLLVMSGQCALALAVALLLAPEPNASAPWLITAVFAWGALQFTQYLIVWSADRPEEIAWYLQRGGVLGRGAVWAGAACLVVVLALFVRPRAGRRGIVAGGAGCVLLVQMLAVLWLVTPSIRGAFVVSLSDVAALVAMVLLSAGFLWFVRPRALAS
jgi:hypothetical protein